MHSVGRHYDTWKHYFLLIVANTLDVIRILRGDTEGDINILLFTVEVTLIFNALICRTPTYLTLGTPSGSSTH